MAFHPYHRDDRVAYTTNNRYLSYVDPDYIKHQNLTDRIDPLLQYNTPCGQQQQSNLAGTSGMQRFLQEPHNVLFSAPHNAFRPNPQCAGIYPDMVSSFHPHSHFRHDSPMSYQQSSATSGPQSPPLTDNDAYVDSTQGPSTPSDAAILSPHIVSWDSQPPGDSLYGLSGAPQGCVNPAAIQPSQDLPDISGGEELSSFTLDSVVDLDSITPTSLCHTDGSSPVLSTALSSSGSEPQENPTGSYPELDDMDVDVKIEDEDAVDAVPSTAEDDDDGEYKPNGRTRSSRAVKSTVRRNRPRRTSSGTHVNKTKVTKPNPSSRAATNRRLLSSTSGGSMTCTHCDLLFTDSVLLQKHINSIHKRPFICVFHFAGCTKIFANKNEWKRHVWAQHLNLNFWICTTGVCGHSPSHSRVVSNTPTYCRVFRRKDLFTQHIRRMHATQEAVRADKKDRNFPAEWVAQEKELQEAALRQRCNLPVYMRCPAKECGTVFDNGFKTWDTRMEHVAVHLERAANNEEPPVVFGGANDEALTEWASDPSVRVIASTGEGWEVCQPLKAARTELSKISSIDGGVDEDAEGEEC
ncbi:hypothetical protein FSARC_641 [Fusarium sarcochroum]|uniref:C2H2-type domain-containing protein n=1 Tax=Fusarium sarcochroum TaxID=1208366 RepID=A0A8H4UAK0_9HYPO|nr:hypothetical protein FSARC_641 [Fusarium sarcochroum]